MTSKNIKYLVIFRRRWEQLFLRWSIVIIPSVYIFHAIIQYFFTFKFPTALNNYGRILTELSLIISLYLVNDLFLNLPDSISQLFADSTLQSYDADANAEYQFIQQFNHQLNHFKIHETMLRQKGQTAIPLNQVADKIVKLKQKLAIALQTDDQISAEALKGQLEACEDYYGRNREINTWPINQAAIVQVWVTQTFLVSQIVAIWNLIVSFNP